MRKRALVACERSGEVRAALADTGYWDEVWSADLEPSEKPPLGTLWEDGTKIVTAEGEREGKGYHYVGDVLGLFCGDHEVNLDWYDATGSLSYWDLIIAHPPCDHLSQAGAVYWKHKDATRGGDGRMQEGAAFFMRMVNAPARYKAVENPVGVMGLPTQACYYRRPDQVTHPWMFGDPLVKRTCWWLENLPPLTATHTEADYPELFRVATGGGSHRTDWKRTGQSNNTYEDRKGRAFRKIERSRTPEGLARAMATQWTAYIREREGS